MFRQNASGVLTVIAKSDADNKKQLDDAVKILSLYYAQKYENYFDLMDPNKFGPYSRPWTQFFSIRTSRPVNNIYLHSYLLKYLGGKLN